MKQQSEQKKIKQLSIRSAEQIIRNIEESALDKAPKFNKSKFVGLYALLMLDKDYSQAKVITKKVLAEYSMFFYPGHKVADDFFQFLSLPKLYDSWNSKEEILNFWSKKNFTKKFLNLVSSMTETKNILIYIRSQMNIVLSLYYNNPEYISQFLNELVLKSTDSYFIYLLNSADFTRLSPYSVTQLTENLTEFSLSLDLNEDYKNRFKQLISKLQ